MQTNYCPPPPSPNQRKSPTGHILSSCTTASEGRGTAFHCQYPTALHTGNHCCNHYLLRVVIACLPFHPRQEFPELDGMSHGNSDDAPADAHRAVLGVGGGLEQLDANVGESHVNEEPQPRDLQWVHHLTSEQHAQWCGLFSRLQVLLWWRQLKYESVEFGFWISNPLDSDSDADLSHDHS